MLPSFAACHAMHVAVPWTTKNLGERNFDVLNSETIYHYCDVPIDRYLNASLVWIHLFGVQLLRFMSCIQLSVHKKPVSICTPLYSRYSRYPPLGGACRDINV